MMSKAAVVISFIALILAISFFMESRALRKDMETLKAEPIEPKVQQEHVHLMDYMIQLQYLMNKVYYAGIHDNKELLAFYIHETEEVLEDIESHRLIKDSIDVSKYIKLFAIEPLALVERNVEITPIDFQQHYQALITQCNGCHGIFKKSFVEVTVPTSPVVSNQRFEPRVP